MAGTVALKMVGVDVKEEDTTLLLQPLGPAVHGRYTSQDRETKIK